MSRYKYDVTLKSGEKRSFSSINSFLNNVDLALEKKLSIARFYKEYKGTGFQINQGPYPTYKDADYGFTIEHRLVIKTGKFTVKFCDEEES